MKSIRVFLELLCLDLLVGERGFVGVLLGLSCVWFYMYSPFSDILGSVINIDPNGVE